MNVRPRRTVLAAVGLALAATAASSLVAAADDIPVSSAEELTEALNSAQPGDTITLAPGSYEGKFEAATAGTADAPITLTGGRDAVLSNGDGYGLHLDSASYWRLQGFAVGPAKKGIVLDDSDHVLLDGVEVSKTEGEAVHFRTGSSDDTIQNSSIHDTGTETPEYGEGVYIGSANNNWEDGPDHSDRIKVLHNKIGPNVAAESVDIKEGTVDGVIKDNTFDGHGIAGENYADSWIDVKGDGYTIEHNTGTFDGDGALVDGYQVHTALDDYGCGTRFVGNDSDLGGAEGYAINVFNVDDCGDAPTVVAKDNTVRDADSGLTNIEPTR